MKSRHNSINKAEKQMIDAKTVVKIKSQLTGNGLCPVFTETELQIARKLFKKDEAQKSEFIFENKCFQKS